MAAAAEDRSQPSEGQPYQARRMAESFGVDPERYDRARPCYPDALVERIVAGSPGPEMLNVGCGTGIAARQFEAAGCTVLGVEPDARMADFARARGRAGFGSRWRPSKHGMRPAGPSMRWSRASPGTG